MKVLFVAYQEASNPLMMYSQGMPYLLGLSKRGVEYQMFTYENRQSFSDSKIFLSKHSEAFKWHYTYFSEAPGILSVFVDLIRGLHQITYIISNNKVQIVHARGFIAALISFLPIKIFRRKLLFDTRGLLADKYSSGGLIAHNGIIYKAMKIMEKFLLKNCDFFTLETNKHSQIIEQDLPQLSKNKIVIPCCIDLVFFKQREKRQDNKTATIVYLGKMGTWHKIKEMFDFYRACADKIQGLSFLFLTPDNASYVKRIAKDRGVKLQSLDVLNPKREDIPSLLSTAAAGIFFINPQHGYNSSHIKFAEYLAMGLPVIVNSGIGDTDTIIREEKVGIVINGFSPSEYEKKADVLKEILLYDDGLKQRCRSVAERHFSLEEGIERYWGVYRNLITR